MKKKNKILLWVMVSVLSLTLVLGIGLVIIGNTQDKLPNLSQSELMVKLNGQIAEMSSDELTDAIDDFQNTIDKYNYPLALVSFEINDEIKKVEVIKKSNDYVLPDWADTETHYLFGWKIEGDDTVYDVLSNYNVEQSIMFSAVIKNHPIVTLQVKEQAPAVEDWQCADNIWIDGVNSYYSVSFYDNADGKQKNTTMLLKIMFGKK